MLYYFLFYEFWLQRYEIFRKNLPFCLKKYQKKKHFLKYGIGCESYNKATCLTKCNYPNKNNWEFTWQFEGKVLYLQRLYDTMKRKHVEPK